MNENRSHRRVRVSASGRARSAIVTVAVCATLAALAGAANAQDAGDKDAARAQAKRHFRAGEQAYNTGQYLAAARAFEESYKLLPIPEIAFSTAQAYRLQYFVDKEPRWLERAIELYREYIDKQPKGGRRDVAITHLAELEPILLRMQAEGAPLGGAAPMSPTQVLISSPIEGARARFRGEESELPMVLDLQPGSYQVSVEAPGYAASTRTFQALEGRFVTVEVTLAPLPAEVRLLTEAGAEITVDGRPEGETPFLGALEIEHGTHIIAVSKRGHRPWSTQVDLGRGQTLELRADLRTTTQRKISYAFVGTAGAGILAGTATALLAGKANKEALELAEKHEQTSLTVLELEQYNRLRTERNNWLGATVVLFGFASLTATVGGLLYYFDTPKTVRPSPAKKQRHEGEASELSISPAVSPGLTGLSVSGRF